MTKEEIENRKEKAIALLNTHTDKYRIFYAEITSINDVTNEDLNRIKRKRELLAIEADVIHTQISMLSELDDYLNTPSEEPVQTANNTDVTTSENIQEVAKEN